jgi:NADH-quinone oxidoreductase subunit N
MKYFLFGSVATACSIYGLSILYGLSGTLDYTHENFATTLIQHASPLLLIGSVLALVGLLFKIVAAPFHLWAPDVYESAPTAVVAFISVIPKLAGIALLARFTLALNLFGNSGYNWQLILGILSMASIIIGNFSALGQINPKRMLAYSSVAQAGFLLVGIVPLGIEGIRFMMFYATIFMITNFLAFHTLSQFENSLNAYKIPSFAGLGRVALLPAIAMLIGFISLTGLPPTAGFSAKLLIFSSLWSTYQQGSNLIVIALLLVGLINTVVSLFFYLKIPYHLFLKEAKSPIQAREFSLSGNLLNLILVFMLIYFFIHPDGLMGWINKINFVL